MIFFFFFKKSALTQWVFIFIYRKNIAGDPGKKKCSNTRIQWRFLKNKNKNKIKKPVQGKAFNYLGISVNALH